MLLPPPETTPSFAVSLSFATPSFPAASIQHCLIGIRGHFAEIRRPVGRENRTRRCRPACWSVSSGYDRGDGLEGHVQLFGHNLPVRGERRCPGRNRSCRCESGWCCRDESRSTSWAARGRASSLPPPPSAFGPRRDAGPTTLMPTANMPPVFTNWRRVSVAPNTSVDLLFLVAIAYLPFAMIVAAAARLR